MDELKDLKRIITSELSKITKKGDISSQTELENANKMVCILEKICKIEEKESEKIEEGYSERSYRPHTMYYDEMPNASYARRRDSMGRYSSRNNYDNGYSGHASKEHMVKQLELMLEEATSDNERMIISDCIEKLER